MIFPFAVTPGVCTAARRSTSLAAPFVAALPPMTVSSGNHQRFGQLRPGNVGQEFMFPFPGGIRDRYTCQVLQSVSSHLCRCEAAPWMNDGLNLLLAAHPVLRRVGGTLPAPSRSHVSVPSGLCTKTIGPSLTPPYLRHGIGALTPGWSPATPADSSATRALSQSDTECQRSAVSSVTRICYHVGSTEVTGSHGGGATSMEMLFVGCFVAGICVGYALVGLLSEP
jgi:hypothetical protein